MGVRPIPRLFQHRQSAERDRRILVPPRRGLGHETKRPHFIAVKRRGEEKMARLSRQQAGRACGAVLCVGMVFGPTAGHAATTAVGASSIKLRLPTVSFQHRTVRFRGFVTFARPGGWTRTAGGAPNATFRVPVAVGCTAIAVVSPEASVTAASASVQLRKALPAASQPGSPVAQQVRIVATGTRAASGAWELVAPPAPTEGGNSFYYYGGMLEKVAHGRWVLSAA